MASLLNTTAHLEHRTPLPSNTTFEKAIALLRDHDFLIKLDPELATYKEEIAPAGANPATKFYSITDNMHALPAGLYDTTVSFKAEMTDVETGIEWVIRAPLGLLQTSNWTIEQRGPEDGIGEEKGKGLVLVEKVSIAANRLLVMTVKSKCMQNYKLTHGKFVAKLAETVDSPKAVLAQEPVAA